ncbi:uncharacterized protein LOC124454066 isoform X2 [Xenia sp. Carnegie-2017]|nr:uncharacterized protein LOC124454066 isoform X2 [Xenia sp. Carnegie-2017]
MRTFALLVIFGCVLLTANVLSLKYVTVEPTTEEIEDDFDDDEDEPINGGMGTSVDTDEVNTLVKDTIDSFNVTVGYKQKEDDEYEKAKCSKKCRDTAMKYITKGEVGKYYNSLVTCMKTCKKRKEHYPFSMHPKKMCIKKCFMSVSQCIMTQGSPKECVEQAKLCINDCRQNFTANNTLGMTCMHNCTDELINCLNSTEDFSMCFQKMPLCVMKCKSDSYPMSSISPFKECMVDCTESFIKCLKSSKDKDICYKTYESSFMKCKKKHLPNISKAVECKKKCGEAFAECLESSGGVYKCYDILVSCTKNCKDQHLKKFNKFFKCMKTCNSNMKCGFWDFKCRLRLLNPNDVKFQCLRQCKIQGVPFVSSLKQMGSGLLSQLKNLAFGRANLSPNSKSPGLKWPNKYQKYPKFSGQSRHRSPKFFKTWPRHSPLFPRRMPRRFSKFRQIARKWQRKNGAASILG